MGAYLHVVLVLEGSEQRVFLFGDLSERDLKKRFLHYYHLGKPVLKNNEVINLAQVKSVHIIETEDPKEESLKKLQIKSKKDIDDFNRTSQSLVLIGPGAGWDDDEIVECGKDVTSRFISAPPGQGTWSTKLLAVLHSPWLLKLIGG